MAELKTKPNDASVKDFLNSVEDETKRKDSFILLDLYSKVTGKQARMWGNSMIGFDMYHYKSERSSQEGDWPLAAFSPRKQNLTLYVMPQLLDPTVFNNLGKYKISKGCLYINKLADVDLNVLEEIVKISYQVCKDKLAN